MEKLYNLLFEAGDYTKSYEEFVEQYGDSKKSEPLYKGLNESGDYTKSFEEFKVQYGFNDSVKKKRLFRTYCSRRGIGIRYRSGSTSWIFGWFRSN